jgi:sulfonate transport system permease protein
LWGVREPWSTGIGLSLGTYENPANAGDVIPLAILMFATSEQSMIFICFIGAFFPLLISTIHGVETLDRRLIYAAQSLGAKNWNILLEVVLPGALPAIVTCLTIGTGSCWLLVVTAEMIAGQFGIGYFTWESYSLQKYPEIVLGDAHYRRARHNLQRCSAIHG